MEMLSSKTNRDSKYKKEKNENKELKKRILEWLE